MKLARLADQFSNLFVVMRLLMQSGPSFIILTKYSCIPRVIIYLFISVTILLLFCLSSGFNDVVLKIVRRTTFNNVFYFYKYKRVKDGNCLRNSRVTPAGDTEDD
jgi:hypothetical protein